MKTPGYVFPSTPQADSGVEATQGLTLRQFYVGLALLGFFADPSTHVEDADSLANQLFSVADALLRHEGLLHE